MEGANRELASWLVRRRPEIESVMALRLGPAAPAPSDPASEALRRFRTYAATALMRGDGGEPALDGVRSNERRVVALLNAWTDAAEEVAGERGDDVRRALEPLVAHFRTCLRRTQTSRRSKGAPRSARRAVAAAIDRVADAFLAIDTDTGQIADANPAAGALLGVQRDALIEVDGMSFVPEPERSAWWTELDALAESDEPRTFRSRLCDVSGVDLEVQASVTRFQTRGRVLALVLARPLVDRSASRMPSPSPFSSIRLRS